MRITPQRNLADAWVWSEEVRDLATAGYFWEIRFFWAFDDVWWCMMMYMCVYVQSCFWLDHWIAGLLSWEHWLECWITRSLRWWNSTRSTSFVQTSLAESIDWAAQTHTGKWLGIVRRSFNTPRWWWIFMDIYWLGEKWHLWWDLAWAVQVLYWSGFLWLLLGGCFDWSFGNASATAFI